MLNLESSSNVFKGVSAYTCSISYYCVCMVSLGEKQVPLSVSTAIPKLRPNCLYTAGASKAAADESGEREQPGNGLCYAVLCCAVLCCAEQSNIQLSVQESVVQLEALSLLEASGIALAILGRFNVPRCLTAG